jgi:thiamine-phosphate diphosphorylase
MFQLYVVADRGIYDSDEEWLEALARVAAASGEREEVRLQVRAKGLAATERALLLRRARKTLGPAAARAILNGAVGEAVELGFGGVHWPEASIPQPGPAPSLLAGASVHSVAALRKGEAAGARFAVFGPVFAPGSKPGEGAGLAALREVVVATRIPLFAIGGITPERARLCIQAGAAGVAAVTGILHAPDAAGAISFYLDAMREASTAPVRRGAAVESGPHREPSPPKLLAHGGKPK